MTLEKSDSSQLPRGWAFLTLNDIVADQKDAIKRGPFGSTIRKEFFVPSGYKVYEQQNVIDRDFTLGNYYIDDRKFAELKDFEIKSGDIVISCSGTIGKATIAPQTMQRGIINQALLKLTLNDAIISKKYFLYLFTSDLIQKKVLTSTRGTAIKNISSVKALKQILFPIPPIKEQSRIVSRVEELFSVLDAGVESLRKVKAQLKRYRQAVLKYAFEGKLTEEWRKTHKNQIQPISLDSTVAQDSLVASDLPENWLSLTIPDIVAQGRNSIKRGPFGSSIKKEYFVPSGYKVYEQKNVIYNDFNLGSYFIGEDKFHQMEDFELKSGDIVITCSGTIGKIAIAPADLKRGIINQALLKLTLDKTRVSSEYFLYLFTSKMHEIISDASRGSAMKNISSVRDLKQIRFPIAPVLEQQKIVEEIEYRFSLADAVDHVTEQALVQTDRLRQSILSTAFQGKLVPQDLADEPAEKLLERIKEERTRQMSKEGTNKIKTSKETLKEVGLMRYVE